MILCTVLHRGKKNHVRDSQCVIDVFTWKTSFFALTYLDEYEAETLFYNTLIRHGIKQSMVN